MNARRCWTLVALVCAGGGRAAFAQGEVLLRLGPNHASPEHAARLVEGWGKVLAKESVGTYRIQLRGGLEPSEALRRLVGRTGVVSARRSWRPGVAALVEDSDLLGQIVAELKLQAHERGLDPEESGVDYFEAYHDYIWQRAYPRRTIDWRAYELATRHRERMPAFGGGGGLGDFSVAGWEFMGPTNLDIPYRTYYGTRPINGRVNGMAWDPVDPSTLYLASAGGGAWKSTNAGTTWTPLSDDWPSLNTSSVAVDPSDRNTVYVGTGDYNGGGGRTLGLMKSTDGGATWTALGVTEFGDHAVSYIAIDPDAPSRVLVSTGRGPGGGDSQVFRSSDGGQTWSVSLGTGAQWCEVEMGCLDSGNGTRRTYAVGSGSGGNVWRSDDRGSTWTRLSPPIGTGSHTRINVATSPIHPDNVYLLVPADRRILKSTDAGTTWSDITAGFVNGNGNYNWSQSTYDAFIACSSRDASIDVLYVGLIDVAQSTDAGASWRSLGGPTWTGSAIVHNDHQGVAVSPHDPNVVLFASDGGAYRMTYTPATNAFSWSFLSKNLGATQFYKSSHHPTNPDIAIGGTQDNATPVSSGDLLNWRNKGGGDGGFAAINQATPNTQYCTSQYLAVYRTTNGWNSSNTITPNVGSDSKLFIAPIALNEANPNHLYAGTNYLWRWTESTQSWTPRLGGQRLAANGAVRSIASCAADANRIYTGATNGDVYMSENGGATWTQINSGSPSLPNRQITYIHVHPENPDDVLVTVSGTGTGHLWRCTNPRAGGARAWVDVSGSSSTALPSVPANAVARDLDRPDTTWFVGTDLGVFVTLDSGANWANATGPLGLPNVQVNDLHAVPGTRMLNAATFGRGMWRLSLPTDTAALLSLSLEPDSVPGGDPSTGYVELAGGAAVSGSGVALSSSSALATVPPTVTVPFGRTDASFPISTSPVGVETPVQISGLRLGIERSATLSLRPDPDVVVPDSFTLNPGILVAGGLPELYNPDDQRLVARLNLAMEQVGFPISLTLGGTSPLASPGSMRFVLEGFSQLSGVIQTIQLYDWNLGAFTTIDSRTASTSDTTVTSSAAGDLSRFVRAGTRQIIARVGWEPGAFDVAFSWRVQVDRAWWRIE